MTAGPGADGGTVCFTSFSVAYLSRARILARSIRRAHPAWRLVALLVDARPAHGLEDFDEVVTAEELRIPRFRSWMFKHDVVEGCTAVKAAMLCRLLAQGAARVIYLDPDMAVFAGLDEIEAALGQSSVVLTPHQIAANTTAQAVGDNETTAFRYGIYNLGFLAVHNDTAGRAFATWWADMLHQACYDDVANAVFTDQRYCDIVPALFDGVNIWRDPGCNVASWNLSRRRLAFDAAGVLRVNGSPLKFYHFTKMGGDGDHMTARYGADNVEVFEVWNWYKRQLTDEAATVPWLYGMFADGSPIPRPARLLYRTRPDLAAAFADPYATGHGTLHDWLRERGHLDGTEP